MRDLLPQANGFVPPEQLGAYYERASIVVVPSRREGYGMTAREAMAHGRPVVATAVGGLRDAVEDGVTGLLVPPGDPTRCASRSSVCSATANSAGLFGEAARQRAYSRFSGVAESRDLLAVYELAASRDC